MGFIKQVNVEGILHDIRDSRIITLADNGTTTAGTWLAKVAEPAEAITGYVDSQLFIYKVTKAGASTTTLNINGLGAKTVYRSGSSKVTTHYGVGTYLLLVYNSSLNSGCFMILNDYDSNTNASHSGIGICSTAAATAAKVVTFPKFALTTNQTILVRVNTTNSATSGVTLNVNSTGAKSIYIGGSAWSTSNQLNAGDYLATYDGTYWKLTRIYLTDNNTTYSAATTSAAGLMSAADKTKLNGIAANANAYSLPLATSSTLGGVKIGYTESGKNYPVELNSSNQMYVNVPWSDTNTTYTAGTGLELSGTQFLNDGVLQIDSGTRTSTPGTINVTHRSGSYEVAVNGLGSAAYTDSSAYAAASHGTHVTAATVKSALGTGTGTSKYLREDGTWVTPPNTTYSAATTSAAGLMSAADKVKLNGIAEGANNYTYSLPAATSSTLGGVKTSTGITNSSGTISVSYGTAAGTACQGNDSRLSDSRTPKSHAHGNINNSGQITATESTTSNVKHIAVTVDDTGTVKKMTPANIRTAIGAGTSNLAIGTTSTTAAAGNHTHNYAGSSSAGGAATSATKVNTNLVIKLNSGTTEGTNLFTFNGSAAKTVNITPSAIGAATSGHTHNASLATSTGTSSITLSHGGKYSLTAGGKSVIFTMPSADGGSGSSSDPVANYSIVTIGGGHFSVTGTAASKTATLILPKGYIARIIGVKYVASTNLSYVTSAGLNPDYTGFIPWDVLANSASKIPLAGSNIVTSNIQLTNVIDSYSFTQGGTAILSQPNRNIQFTFSFQNTTTTTTYAKAWLVYEVLGVVSANSYVA